VASKAKRLLPEIDDVAKSVLLAVLGLDAVPVSVRATVQQSLDLPTKQLTNSLQSASLLKLTKYKRPSASPDQHPHQEGPGEKVHVAEDGQQAPRKPGAAAHRAVKVMEGGHVDPGLLTFCILPERGSRRTTRTPANG
jgi:hypothetical protein